MTDYRYNNQEAALRVGQDANYAHAWMSGGTLGLGAVTLAEKAGLFGDAFSGGLPGKILAMNNVTLDTAAFLAHFPWEEGLAAVGITALFLCAEEARKHAATAAQLGVALRVPSVQG